MDPAAVFAAAAMAAPSTFALETALRAYPRVRVGPSALGGRGLFATAAAAPGDVLVVEPAFLWEDRGAVTAVDEAEAVTDARVLQMAPFGLGGDGAFPDTLSLPSGLTRERAITEALRANSFAVVLPAGTGTSGGSGGGGGGGGAAGGAAAAAAAAAAGGGSGSRGAATPPPVGEGTPAATLHVALSDSLDAARGEADARALFSVICLTNHSCAPNAKAYQQMDEEGGPRAAARGAPAYVLEAREPIAAGEEVTVSYLPRTWRAVQRGAALTGVWGIVCRCPRCVTGVDDTIVARCPACADGRVYWPLEPTATPACIDCGARLSRDAPCRTAGAPLPLAAITDDAAMLDLVFAGEPGTGDLPPVPTLADRLLSHPVMALEDARAWASLHQLLGMTTQEDDPDTWNSLLHAVALTSLRAPYTNPHDVGIDVVTE